MAKTKLSILLPADLKFERKNQRQIKLPPNVRIQRRPLSHAPIASPYAGASAPKIVYVSSSSLLMAVVKRVKKLLVQIEKRAMQNVDISDGKMGLKKLAKASENLDKSGEKVFVK